MIDYFLMEDNQLIELIKKNSNAEACLQVLIDRHSGLCVDMINNYCARSHNQSTHEELMKDKDFQIYSSALKFDPEKGSKFSTYLGNEIKWKCLNIYNRNKTRKTIPVEENLINYFSYINQEPNESESHSIFQDIINHAKSDKDERVGKIFELRYVEGKHNTVMPWKNISKKIGMSIQGCINIHDSALRKIKHKIRKEINE